MRKQQQGLTLIGFIFVLIIAGFFALMAMKLVPSYVEYSGVAKAMEQIAADSGSANKPLKAVCSDLAFKGSFQYVDDGVFDCGKTVKMKRGKGGTKLIVDYEKKIHFIYNISFLLHFSKTVDLKG